MQDHLSNKTNPQFYQDGPQFGYAIVLGCNHVKQAREKFHAIPESIKMHNFRIKIKKFPEEGYHPNHPFPDSRPSGERTLLYHIPPLGPSILLPSALDCLLLAQPEFMM